MVKEVALTLGVTTCLADLDQAYSGAPLTSEIREDVTQKIRPKPLFLKKPAFNLSVFLKKREAAKLQRAHKRSQFISLRDLRLVARKTQLLKKKYTLRLMLLKNRMSKKFNKLKFNQRIRRKPVFNLSVFLKKRAAINLQRAHKRSQFISLRDLRLAARKTQLLKKKHTLRLISLKNRTSKKFTEKSSLKRVSAKPANKIKAPVQNIAAPASEPVEDALQTTIPVEVEPIVEADVEEKVLVQNIAAPASEPGKEALDNALKLTLPMLNLIQTLERYQEVAFERVFNLFWLLDKFHNHPSLSSEGGEDSKSISENDDGLSDRGEVDSEGPNEEDSEGTDSSSESDAEFPVWEQPNPENEINTPMQNVFEEEDDDERRPDEHRCRITHEVMRKPVVADDGNSYEEDVLLGFLLKRDLTELPFKNRVFFPNHALRKLINDWRPGLAANDDGIDMEDARKARRRALLELLNQPAPEGEALDDAPVFPVLDPLAANTNDIDMKNAQRARRNALLQLQIEQIEKHPLQTQSAQGGEILDDAPVVLDPLAANDDSALREMIWHAMSQRLSPPAPGVREIPNDALVNLLTTGVPISPQMAPMPHPLPEPINSDAEGVEIFQPAALQNLERLPELPEGKGLFGWGGNWYTFGL